METVLKNARLVTKHEVIKGSLKISGAMINDLSSNGARQGLDLEGDYLIPGLVEPHTDNLERHLVPRPGVHWPSPLGALIGHDADMISSGITTTLDSLYLGFDSYDDKYAERGKLLDRAIEAIDIAQGRGLLRSEHLLHLRCEVVGSDAAESLKRYLDQKVLVLVSLMDHTPGQRQWRDISKWRQFHSCKNWSEDEAASALAKLQASQAEYADKNSRAIVALAKEHNLPIASHDDTTVEHVDQAHALGVRISEFPTTLDAARRATDLGMHVVGGTPNLVRGESHSGNVSIRDLARHEALNCLSSDYVPVSLLHAVFMLHHELGYELPRAVAMVSANPAKALGLADRGSLEIGLRADLARVRLVDGLPVVINTWRSGRQVL